MKKLLVITFALVGALAFSEERVPASLSSSETQLKLATDAQQKVVVASTQQAVKILELHKPEGDTAFGWKNKDEIKGKSILIRFVRSTENIVKNLPANTDIVTATLSPKEGELMILVLVVVDRVFEDGNGKEREDALIRLHTGLAHAYFGDVQRILKAPIGSTELKTFDERKNATVAAYEEALKYLERFKKGKLYAAYDAKEQKFFAEREEFMKAGLEAWKNRTEKK